MGSDEPALCYGLTGGDSGEFVFPGSDLIPLSDDWLMVCCTGRGRQKGPAPAHSVYRLLLVSPVCILTFVFL
jgi:hypothetical protein